MTSPASPDTRQAAAVLAASACPFGPSLGSAGGASAGRDVGATARSRLDAIYEKLGVPRG